MKHLFTALLLVAAYNVYGMPSDASMDASEFWYKSHSMALLTLLAGTPVIILLLNFSRYKAVRLLLLLCVIWTIVISGRAVWSLCDPYFYEGTEGGVIILVLLCLALDGALLGLSFFTLKRLRSYTSQH